MSTASDDIEQGPHGMSLLPCDLTESELAAAPVPVSADALLIDGLTDEEDDGFAAALS